MNFFALFLTIALSVTVNGHKYKTGSCPAVEPMMDFDIEQFLGPWYVIQKTGTEQQCIMYNISLSDTDGKFLIQQVSQNYLFGLTSLRHKYSYTGELELEPYGMPGQMKVLFPLNPIGSSRFTVFSANYDGVAGIFTCQALPFIHRQSASILSRTRDFNTSDIQKVRSQLVANGIDLHDLNTITHNNCPELMADGISIKINPDTFSAEFISKWAWKNQKLIDGTSTDPNAEDQLSEEEKMWLP